MNNYNLRNIVINGDVLNVLDDIPNECIHLTFTSPPYFNARDYSNYNTYDDYLKFLHDVFEKTYRITKEGRFLIVNTSPVIEPRINRQHQSKRYAIPFDLHNILTDIGWDFIDDIIWEKPETSVKNRIGSFSQHRKPLAYKPNCVTEYIMVYRKHTDKLIDWNIRQYNKEIQESSKVGDNFETSNIWKIQPKHSKIHPAIFPDELCKKVIEYYSYKGDLVFEPFAGSGTLGRVANKMNRYSILVERNEEYFNSIKDTLSCEGNFSFLTYDEFKNGIIQSNF